MKSKIITLGELEIRFNWIIAFFIFIVFCGLVRLGIWQMSRAQEKIQLQTSYEEMGADYAVPVEDVAMSGLENDAQTIQNLHVSLKGYFLNDKTLYQIYQSYEGTLGYAIITPFQLASSDKIAFVNRGWVHANTYEEIQAKVEPIPGNLTIEGQIFVPTLKQAERTNEVDFSNPGWPLEIRWLNTLELDPLFEESIFPYEIRLDEEQPGKYISHWPAVMVDTGKNFSYALQWFSMSIALLLVSLILSSNLLQILKKRSKPI